MTNRIITIVKELINKQTNIDIIDSDENTTTSESSDSDQSTGEEENHIATTNRNV